MSMVMAAVPVAFFAAGAAVGAFYRGRAVEVVEVAVEVDELGLETLPAAVAFIASWSTALRARQVLRGDFDEIALYALAGAAADDTFDGWVPDGVETAGTDLGQFAAGMALWSALKASIDELRLIEVEVYGLDDAPVADMWVHFVQAVVHRCMHPMAVAVDVGVEHPLNAIDALVQVMNLGFEEDFDG